MLPTLALLAALHLAPAADPFTGTWQIKGDVAGTAFSEVCTIAQDGAKLTGSCTGPEAGKSYEMKGEVKDGKATFQHAADYNGDALTLIFTATISAAREMKGSVNVLPYSIDGDFTATVAPAK